MDIYKSLVLIKNSMSKDFEDKTDEIERLEHIGNQVSVTYMTNNKAYNYNSSNVRILKDPKVINTDYLIACVDGFPVRNTSLIMDFGDYVKIINDNRKTEAFHKTRITYQKSCLKSDNPKTVFDYFKSMSEYISVLDNGRNTLLEQYEKILKVSEASVLSAYLSGELINKDKTEVVPIFPFGLNLSQKKAVKSALANSISIIEGPPGTGKTQTILNIIANAVSRGESVGIVSGNNSAVLNVQEKLEKNGYGFICAMLGNLDNKADFFENKQSQSPDLNGWSLEEEQEKVHYEQLESVSKELEVLLEDKNKIAKLKEELSKLEVEQHYFQNSFKSEYIPSSRYSFSGKWSIDSILEFITRYERLILAERDDKFSGKFSLFISHGIYKFKYVNANRKNIIDSMKFDYYKRAIELRKDEISSLERKLENKSYKGLMDKYTEVSSKIFKSALHKKYCSNIRGNYTIKSFKHNFKDFIKDYPVILSTTHSIMRSIPENYLFDYMIIDEASQVDLVTASLALACSKNVVIVGDVNQLPPIVPDSIKKINDSMFYKKNIDEAYNYSKFSIIESLMKLYKDGLPKTLLSEHYRCHPKIIGFCNDKFYNNQLIIMTEEELGDSPLKIYKTAPGNHTRRDRIGDEKGWFNVRQIEVLRDEILNDVNYTDFSEIGIISPYRKHANETEKIINGLDIEVDTVHKFQGREKNTIIFATVANDINPFIDDANLINVAVSRAIKELIIVTSNKLFKQHGTNIGDLMRYITYNSMDKNIIESEKISVFDLLYSEYSEKLTKVMKSAKHISEYESENYMYSVIGEVLGYAKFSCFKCVIHIPLSSIVKDFTQLNGEERSFAGNPLTHVDFLIYNKLDKEPALVVEVDGYENHKNNKKQMNRDALKDNILKQIKLPILRVATNESGEKEKLERMLDEVVKKSGEVDFESVIEDCF